MIVYRNRNNVSINSPKSLSAKFNSSYLNNAQTEKLQEVLAHALFGYEVAKTDKDENVSEQNLVELFLAAKRIEGCSEKSLKYYESTIMAMLDELHKEVKQIDTDDIRSYPPVTLDDVYKEVLEQAENFKKYA